MPWAPSPPRSGPRRSPHWSQPSCRAWESVGHWGPQIPGLGEGLRSPCPCPVPRPPHRLPQPARPSSLQPGVQTGALGIGEATAGAPGPGPDAGGNHVAPSQPEGGGRVAPAKTASGGKGQGEGLCHYVLPGGPQDLGCMKRWSLLRKLPFRQKRPSRSLLEPPLREAQKLGLRR